MKNIKLRIDNKYHTDSFYETIFSIRRSLEVTASKHIRLSTD